MTYQNRGVNNPKHHIDPKKLQIVAVRKDDDGDISEVKFQNGQIASIDEAIVMAEQDLIEDVNTGTTRGKERRKTLRSYPDGDPSNNLSNLPPF
ncbi:gp654 [Bacillus phage G]|uniref:Gp654 n=1 Tax=Bacillus phage G TaxID=2884420 RepID=G3MB34_9CAUD|nr:gp654 [Bacillus phage G]AEO93897.1 gp654 [Bacillus phage G]